jgi:hypothetical protein
LARSLARGIGVLCESRDGRKDNASPAQVTGHATGPFRARDTTPRSVGRTGRRTRANGWSPARIGPLTAVSPRREGERGHAIVIMRDTAVQRMLPAGRGMLAVARTQSSRAPVVHQPPSRHPGRGHVRNARDSGRVSFLYSHQARQPARTHQFFVRSRAGSGARPRARKVHEPLLRGGIRRARALREGGVRSRRRGPAASCFARPAPSWKASAFLRSSRAPPIRPRFFL